MAGSARLALLPLAALLVACEPPPTRADSGANESPSTSGPKRTATIPADGWNDDIAWRGLTEGLAEAAEIQRPVMVVVHTSWCPKCRALKQVFNDDADVERLSEHFVMVHVDQDQTPQALLYAPDGEYIPRVLFLDAKGNLDESLSNRGRKRFRYFYTPQEDLAATMREALDRHGHAS